MLLNSDADIAEAAVIRLLERLEQTQIFRFSAPSFMKEGTMGRISPAIVWVWSLVAHKPVIVTNAIPMADYVRQHQCGIVLDDVRLDSLIAAIETLKSRYGDFTRNAKLIEPDVFSIQSMVDRHRELYGL